MKVKVTKAHRDTLWYAYAGHIGEVFEVDPSSIDGWYRCTEEIGSHIKATDCEVLPEYTKGQRVRILDTSELAFEYEDETEATVRAPMNSDGEVRITMWDGDTQYISSEHIAPMDEPTLTKEEALSLAIKGAKVVNKNWMTYPETYVSFDGRNFRFGTTNVIANGVLDYDTGWKLWEEPKPEPKFSIGEFMVDGDGDYARVESMECIDGQWVYETKYSINNNSVNFAESQLSKV